MAKENLSNSLFSHRKGLIAVNTLLRTDCMPTEVANAIDSCYCQFCDDLMQLCYKTNNVYLQQEDINRELWIHFLNQPLTLFKYETQGSSVFLKIIHDDTIDWNRKLDLVEYLIRWSREQLEKIKKKDVAVSLERFVHNINSEFSRLDYGYRVVCDRIVEVIDDEERQCIEHAVSGSKDNVQEHLHRALEHLSKKPHPDVRNSIKESVSAVEYVCREITGESTLGKSLAKLEVRGIHIHSRLREGMEKFYIYTNQPDTGIRHALMDDDGKNVPSKAEAYYMLITCSAFLNYLRMKITDKQQNQS